MPEVFLARFPDSVSAAISIRRARKSSGTQGRSGWDCSNHISVIGKGIISNDVISPLKFELLINSQL